MLKGIGAIAALALIFGTSVQATTYNLNLTPGTGSVAGYIQTDGTVGQLVGGNIMDWSLTITTNGGFETIDMANSAMSYFAGSTALSATSSQLIFDFSDPTGDFLLFQGGTFSATFLCVQSSSSCGGGPPGFSIGRAAGGGNTDNEAVSGEVAFADAAPVPLPAAGMSLVLGLAGLGALARRRRSSV
ncbi:MAG: hypothetical protein AAF092_00980 [Pseudomonadota bacterium]